MQNEFKNQSGLSLVELMISITLGLILMTGVVQIFLSSKESFSSQQGISRIQETGRLAIEFMTRDIRHIGTTGCSRENAADPMQLRNANIVLSAGTLHTSFNEGLRGYNKAADLPNASAALGLGLVNPNENILVIRAAQELGLGITQPTTANDIVVHPNGAAIINNCVAGLCVGDAAVVTDCYNGTVIRIAALNPVGALISVNHADAWQALAPFNYRSGFVSPVSTVVYFIADSPGTPAGRTSLFKRTNITPPEEVLEGVERMSITYAVGLGAYQDATTVTGAGNWPNVTSVRIELVVRSTENFVVSEAAPYTFRGEQVVPTVTPTGEQDRYLRQVFSTTIDIRSR
jgi:type IV pilus assembly protein PilW